VRFLIPLAALAMSFVASVADARPAIVFPDSGRLPPDPWFYVATDDEPKITITSGGRRVPFTVYDDMHFRADGLRWVQVAVELKDGPFTVAVGSTRARFTIDPALAPKDVEVGDIVDDGIHFDRMGIERGDTLTIDAHVPRGTALYFLNHTASSLERPHYVWIGPGQKRGDSTRFELPLARLGVSCAGTGTVQLSLYTTAISSGDTLYPFSNLTVDRGRVKLPVGSFAMDEEKQPWLPCPGASVRIEPPAYDQPEQPRPPFGDEPAPSEPPAVAPAPTPAPRPSSRPWPWWQGGVLLLLAGLGTALARRLPARCSI
jgi:hypothetical protein